MATTSNQGQCLFLWKACRYQRWLNKVHTGDTHRFDRCWDFSTCNLSILLSEETTPCSVYHHLQKGSQISRLSSPNFVHTTKNCIFPHVYICTRNWFGLMEQFGWTRIGVVVGITECDTHYFHMQQKNSVQCYPPLSVLYICLHFHYTESL